MSDDRTDETPDAAYEAGSHGVFDPVADLLATLDLELLGDVAVALTPKPDAPRTDLSETLPNLYAEDVTVFRGPSQRTPHGRVFGGQVLAQSVMACGRTVTSEPGQPERLIHSLHAYFIRPGDDKAPMHFAVERLRDGNSFSTRRVHALQHGAAILTASASFQEPAGGIDHHDRPHDVPDPEELTPLDELFAQNGRADMAAFTRRRPVDQRHVNGSLFVNAASDRSSSQSVWLRTRSPLPDEPLLHAAVLAYASDYTLLEANLRRHGLTWSDPRLRVASLDHAMWFHRPGRLDDWILYEEHAPSAQGGRGLGLGRMFSRDGSLVASVAQEGMIRLKEGS